MNFFQIGYLESLKRAYPRYSLAIGSVFLTTFTIVSTLCLYIIDRAKHHQIQYMTEAFSDANGLIGQLNFETENLDIYAVENLICQILDQNPNLVSKFKKEVLAEYVANMTGNETDVSVSKTYILGVEKVGRIFATITANSVW